MVERVSEQGSEPDDQPHERVEQPVDRPLERRARMPERPRLPGHTGGKAVLADSGDAICAGPLEDERAG